MKKTILVVALVGALFTLASAQPRAIGVRFGNGADFSYQHSIGEKNMLDCTAGVSLGWLGHPGVTAVVMFDWVFDIKSGWKWYVGPGAGVGWGWGPAYKDHDYFPLRVNVGGQIGIEYNFGIPLNLSLDVRPMVNVLGFKHHHMDYWFDFGPALGVRYRFNK